MTGMHTFPLGVHKLTTSAYFPSGNGGVERVYHTMSKVQAMVCNEHQHDWDALSTSNTPKITPRARRQASPPMKYIGCLPRPFLAVFDRSYGGAHHSLDYDHLAYCDLGRERQQRAYELVHEQHALTVARVNGRNFTLSDALLRKYYYSGQLDQPTISPAPDRINSCVPTQPRARSSSPKVNITSREPTDSSLTMFIVLASYSLP